MATLVGFQMLQENPSLSCHSGERPASTPGPFRATQLWNGIVEHLKLAVDVKTRKHLMRSYEDCFTGADAVDVICDYLERDSVEGRDITREKISKLCQYFLDQNIIEDVQASGNFGNKRALFEDSASHFYRFCSKDVKEEFEGTGDTAAQSYCHHASPSDTSKPCRRFSIDVLQDQFDRRKKRRSSFGLGRSGHRASLAEGRGSNLKGIQNPAFEGPHSQGGTLAAILSPSRRPLAPHNTPGEPFTPAFSKLGRESRREKRLSKDVVSEIWKEAIIQRILHLVDLSHLDNLLACAANYQYESAQHVERSARGAATRMSTRRNVTRPNLDSIDPWLKSALYCLEVHPEGSQLRRDFAQNWPQTSAMLHARKLLLYQAIVGLFTEAKPGALIPLLLMDIVTMILGALGGGKSSRAIELTQLCVLLLPAATRLQLRALLRFMGEASKNTAVKLTYQVDNRTNVCNTFCSAIISSPLLAAVQAKNLVSFFLDTQNRIFKVPEAVLQAVTARLQQAKQGEKDLCRVVYCQRISPEEFEVKGHAYTHEMVKGLMNAIIDDTRIPLKEKKQRLKQLQKTHGDVFAQHFSDMQ
ncbi:DEP domain-containing protein 7-like [Diadema setosum]|uniref:DEP domain-containing protein 7-like n=1 Tax=Diadema setosum TaxID=31175 RepID=UPI003B3AB466